MTRRQLSQLQHNHRGRAPGAVLATPATARWLERAARQVQQREDGQAAWHRCAPAEIATETRVIAFEDGVLSIAVESGAARFELSRQAAQWRRTLGPYVRGLREVRFVPGSTAEPLPPAQECD